MLHCIVKRNLHGDYRLSFFNDFHCKSVEKPLSSRDYEHESLARSKRAVIDYGMNNDWSFFVTFTFDGNKIDRYNYAVVLKRLTDSLKYYRKHYDSAFRYVLLPEKHTDGAIHFHGLFYVENFTTIERHFDVKKHCEYFRIDYFYQKFGRFRLDKIQTNALYVSAYITKYITKANERLFYKRYICSKGLNSGEVVVDVSGDNALPYLDIMSCHCVYSTGEILEIKPVVNRDYCKIYSIDETTFKMLFG